MLWVKINIYIKILVCGEEFVFVVMGRKEDVVMVWREIIFVVEYFFMICVLWNKNMVFNGVVFGLFNLFG